ncbi:MAG: hypothetical protein WD077_06415 [Bacteroidia bacterium]
MDVLNKTIKKLNEQDFENLILEIPGGEDSKPYAVLTAARNNNYSDSEMMEMLKVNPSTYYTLKSRLKTKVAYILSKKVDNPISELMEEVARVPATLYGTSKAVSIRALKDLEKQLIEYDLSNELIVVYETLARLNLYNEEYEKYDMLYSKHVAFSLAVTKAQKLFYSFIFRIGNYGLTGHEEDREELNDVRRKLNNIQELYDSHRLFVLNNIVRIYHLSMTTEDVQELRSLEIEIENILKSINEIIQKYELDTFYQKMKFIVDFLYYGYYVKTGNYVRAEHHYKKIIGEVPELSKHHVFNFYILSFLSDRVQHFIATGNSEILFAKNDEILENLDIERDEIYHNTVFHQYQAICKHYKEDHFGAAKMINDLRNEVSLRNFVKTDIECKLFQAMEYCIAGEEDLCVQLINSVNRQVKDMEGNSEHAKIFIKFIKAALKSTEFDKKVKRLKRLADEFNAENTGDNRMLTFIKLDEPFFKKLASPFKYKYAAS